MFFNFNKGTTNMKEIYTKAALRKCSKPRALNMLEVLYQNMSEEDKKNNSEMIADLMSFFTPKPTGKKPKTPLEWVNLAVSTEATRYYLCASYSDGKYLVATDGHRLHRMETKLPEGYYDKLGNAIELDGNFPQYERLFFDVDRRIKVTLDIEKAGLEHHGKKWHYVFDVNNVEVGFNKKYVDEALNGKTSVVGHIDVDIDFKAKKDEPLKDVEARRISEIEWSPFQSEDKSFMLMPIRLHAVRNT